MIKISKICLQQNTIFIKNLKLFKSTAFLFEIREFFFILFYNLHKENTFTTEIEDGREAP